MGKEDLKMMASSLTFFTGVLKSDQVGIFVGPTQERFNVNKKALTPAKVLESLLEQNLPGKHKNSIILLEDDPEVFEQLLEFTYRGRIEAKQFHWRLNHRRDSTHDAVGRDLQRSQQVPLRSMQEPHRGPLLRSS
jgi:hypothetical protein